MRREATGACLPWEAVDHKQRGGCAACATVTGYGGEWRFPRRETGSAAGLRDEAPAAVAADQCIVTHPPCLYSRPIIRTAAEGLVDGSGQCIVKSIDRAPARHIIRVASGRCIAGALARVSDLRIRDAGIHEAGITGTAGVRFTAARGLGLANRFVSMLAAGEGAGIYMGDQYPPHIPLSEVPSRLVREFVTPDIYREACVD